MDRKRRSGGPRTTEGKLAASKNAIKTGAYSATLILPGEKEEDFLELKEQFTRDFAPQDVAEAAMVHELAILTWKQLRLQRLEHAELLRRLNTRIVRQDFAIPNTEFREDCEWVLDDLSQITPERVQEGKEIRSWLSANGTHGLTRRQWDQLVEDEHPLLVPLLQFAREELKIADKELTFERLDNAVFEAEMGHLEPYFAWALRRMQRRADQFLWVAERLDWIQQAVTDIKQHRLLEALRLPTSTRARDDLSRAFHRTLGELRRHQQWRRQMNAIDVTPEASRVRD